MASDLTGYEIGKTRRDELDRLPEIERAAAAVFSPDDLPAELRDEVHDLSFFEQAAATGRLWVARALSPPLLVGFAVVELVDGSAHLAEMDVHPHHGRRGLGRALVGEAVRWGQRSGYRSLTLTTFRHLRWNGPFYASLGFFELERKRQGPELSAILAAEANEGLDASKRVAMKMDLEATD